MRYRLMAMDLDDTLLTDELTVSEPTKEAMKRAIAQGVHLTIATGRMFASAQQVAKQVGLNVPIITYQGSLVRNLLDEQVLYERAVPTAAAARLYEYCREHGMHLQTYIEDRLYTAEDNDQIQAYAAQSSIPYVISESFETLVTTSPHQTKLVVIDEPARLDAAKLELERLLGPDVHLTKSKDHYLELLHREGTKGHALRFLADYYDIPLEETIAIGDAWNDKEMIEVAGLGVAMANAVPGLKDLADYVTLSNNEDGVKHVLEKFVLAN